MTNASAPIRYAIVGGGAGIAKLHLDALKQISNAQLVALVDINPQPAQQRADEMDCEYFAEHGAMLAATQPDVVVICTPHPLHPAVAIDAFAAGAHVITEKPIAIQVSEADRMIAAGHAAGKWLVVNFQQRFRTAAQRAKQIVDDGVVGELVRVASVGPWYRPEAYFKLGAWRGTWRGEGGGILMNQSPHTLDLVCWLAGTPRKVWGWTRTRGHAIEVEDTMQAMLEFANGAPGYITASTFETGAQKRLQIIGEKGMVEIIDETVHLTRFSQPIREHMRTSTEPFSAPGKTTEVFDLPDVSGGHLAVYQDLQNAIATGRTPLITGEQGRMSLELANAITLSAHEDRAITLPVDRAAYAALLAKLQMQG
jgi:predicted dehydrogenase